MNDPVQKFIDVPEAAVYLMNEVLQKAEQTAAEFGFSLNNNRNQQIREAIRVTLSNWEPGFERIDRASVVYLRYLFERLSEAYLWASRHPDPKALPFAMFRRIGSGLYEMELLCYNLLKEGTE